jgi:carbonic anhydrase
MPNKEPRDLLEANRAWAAGRVAADPNYFTDMAKGQNPEFLWIGCSDSRVPAEDITGSAPGDLFVARNIANLVVHTDLNLMSVIEYGVVGLGVKHIVVCGHYGCGGVKAAMTDRSYGIFNKWIRNIKDIAYIHRDELEALPSPETRERRLIELNVIEQAKNLTHTSIVQKAWHRGQELTIHGWVYDIANGRLNDMISIDNSFPIPPIFRYDFNR